jgi:AAA+ superfamily predicted ATPase
MNDAFAHLDRALLAACDHEERRAALLAAGGAVGWEGVRNLARPAVADLLYSDCIQEPPPLPQPGPAAPPALLRLADAFALSPLELAVLLLVLAPHVEPRYRTLYGVLQDAMSEPWATERLLLAVLGRTPDRRRELLETLAPSGRLRETGLVTLGEGQPPLSAAIDLPVEIRGALLDLPPPTALDVIPLAWFEGEAPEPAPAVLAVFGEGPRDRAFAAAVAGAARVVAGPVRDGERAGSVARALWRLGAAYGAVPAFDLTGLEDLPARRLAEHMVRRVRGYGGRLAFLAARPLPLPIPHHEAPRLSYADRREAWLDVARERGAELDPAAAARFAGTFRLDPTRIREAFDNAPDGSETALARAAVRLSAERIPHGNAVEPARSFDDIVLVDTTRESLRRLIFFAQNRDRIAEERGLEHRYKLRRGPVVLFSGRSGTGKTLAAEIVAGALQRPLHVVDLARLVSKYVGETEKNIDEVLASGEQAGAVLFFDEADSLFSQRTEVSNSNDRFANLEVGYLLQRIETHDGLVILATNLRQSIDDAFLRRFHTRVEFPLPGPAERRRIWELMLPPGVPRSEDLHFESLGREHKLTGGDIRNAALKAIFLAEEECSPVTQTLLERAVALELLELGRLSRRDSGTAPGRQDCGSQLRAYTKALQETVENHLRAVFLKEIHIIHGAPTKENLAGKRPAVSLALFRLAQPRSGGLRLGFVVSAWSNRAEEEHELLGVLHELLATPARETVPGMAVVSKVSESHDFDLLHRFWSSHGHPVRASVLLDVELKT